jgi:hypothetical protein
MGLELLTENLTNLVLLFFVLGIIAAQLKSILEVPTLATIHHFTSNIPKDFKCSLIFANGFDPKKPR